MKNAILLFYTYCYTKQTTTPVHLDNFRKLQELVNQKLSWQIYMNQNVTWSETGWSMIM